MAWKLITEQEVVAHLDGKVRQVVVIAWESRSGAVRVEWPPPNSSGGSPNSHWLKGKTTIEKARYEPIDPDSFRIATTG